MTVKKHPASRNSRAKKLQCDDQYVTVLPNLEIYTSEAGCCLQVDMQARFSGASEKFYYFVLHGSDSSYAHTKGPCELLT
jgi:hypothetical protein